jgi:hypothetical protein
MAITGIIVATADGQLHTIMRYADLFVTGQPAGRRRLRNWDGQFVLTPLESDSPAQNVDVNNRLVAIAMVPNEMDPFSAIT